MDWQTTKLVPAVREYQPSDKPGVFALKKVVDGMTFDEELWRWKFETGPVRSARIFVVDGAGQVVGLRAFIIERLKAAGETFLAGLGVEVMVHPEFRRYGIAAAMASEGFELMEKKGVPVLLGFPNEVAYKVYSRTRPNWGPVCIIPLLVKPISIPRICRHYSPLLRPFLNLGARIVWALFARERRPRPGDLTIERASSFGDDFDTLWQEASGAYTIGLVRDRAFLSWRFSRPGEKYTVLTARRQGKLAGYIVLKNDEMFNLRLGLIVDMLTLSEGDIAPGLVAAALAHFREQQLDAIGCLMLRHVNYFRALQKAGFLALPNKFSPKRFYFGVQVKPATLQPEIVYDHRNWFLTFADIDIA
ncbi:MAG: GNAT family N-acetyltransferase [Chloroflexi bacterium]|nr:GNAT family N-acetyltransferase [Chloroflexota bacterium]